MLEFIALCDTCCLFCATRFVTLLLIATKLTRLFPDRNRSGRRNQFGETRRRHGTRSRNVGTNVIIPEYNASNKSRDQFQFPSVTTGEGAESRPCQRSVKTKSGDPIEIVFSVHFAESGGAKVENQDGRKGGAKNISRGMLANGTWTVKYVSVPRSPFLRSSFSSVCSAAVSGAAASRYLFEKQLCCCGGGGTHRRPFSSFAFCPSTRCEAFRGQLQVLSIDLKCGKGAYGQYRAAWLLWAVCVFCRRVG